MNAGDRASTESRHDGATPIEAAVRVVEDAIIAAASLALPGARTIDLSNEAARVIERSGATAVLLGYADRDAPPFPAAACVSVNDQVVHGVPGPRVLEPGDLVTIDVSAQLDGWCADSAVSVVVPGSSPRTDVALALIEATRDVLALAVSMIAPGVRWSEVARALEARARAGQWGIVTEFVGHGVGRALHLPPSAPAYWTAYEGPDFVLEEGAVLAVEPILTMPEDPGATVMRRGGWATPISVLNDGWTVVTRTGELACHEERMVRVTRTGCEVLTRRLVRLLWGGGI